MSHPQSYEILLVPAFTDDRRTAGKEAGTKGSGAGHSGSRDAAAEDRDTKEAAAGDQEPRDSGAGDRGTGAGAGDEDTKDVAPGDQEPRDPDAGAQQMKDSGAGESGSRAAGTARPGAALRSAIVAATGETGESGYPRYAGDGMVADIDPATHTVEALLVDGSELDYGLTVRVSERNVEG
ncbi:hypothetical protein [Streptomyces sp. NBC_01013]|uniref:hypothetical protein n=1 Tax=Streptomyces sp. NBC_01013 TaxID=2903718 RepID=UPI003868DAD4